MYHQMRTRGEGVKNAGNCADFLYVWLLIPRSLHRFSLSEKMQLIDRCFARGSVREIIEALDDSGDAWAAKQAANMRKMSPTSMEVTFK